MCIFCEIIKGNIPAKVIYEDDAHLGILDLSQTTKGHCLMMPKQHYENLTMIPAIELAQMIVRVQEVATRVMHNTGAKGFNLLVNNGEAAGQTIEHLHFHIIPRYDENDTIEINFQENDFDLDEIKALVNTKGKR